MRKIIIVVAPVCAYPVTEVKNPVLPEELVEEVSLCSQAGAAEVHLHVRDLQGNLTSDTTVFSQAIAGIRSRSDIIINGSTGGISGLSKEERCTALEDPYLEVASLNMGSVNMGDEVFINSMPEIRYWARRMAERGIHPELEIFEAGMVHNVKILAREGILKPPFSFAFCPGFDGALPADPDTIFLLKNMLPPGSIWGINHANMTDFSLLATCVGMGASFVRVGFEDGITYKSGCAARNNAELVSRLADLIRSMGYEVATAAEARKIYGI